MCIIVLYSLLLYMSVYHICTHCYSLVTLCTFDSTLPIHIHCTSIQTNFCLFFFRNRSHTSKIHDSKGCYKCSIGKLVHFVCVCVFILFKNNIIYTLHILVLMLNISFIARNPFSDQRYLLAAVPKGILVMQWYQPRHAFMHVKLFECALPSPLNMFEAFVVEDDEYPSICVGVRDT